MIVGVDSATNRVHAVLLSNTGVLIGTWKSESKDESPDARRIHLCREFVRMLGIWTREPGTHVFFEEPLALQNGKTTRLLGLAGGALWACQLGLDLFWHWVDVAAWKKTHLILTDYARRPEIRSLPQKHRGKAAIRLWALEHGAPNGWDEDHYDAFAIAHHGLLVLSQAKTRANT
jgi:hypothetical protein